MGYIADRTSIRSASSAPVRTRIRIIYTEIDGLTYIGALSTICDMGAASFSQFLQHIVRAKVVRMNSADELQSTIAS